MNNTLTTEDKERIWGLYIGSKYKFPNGKNEEIITGVVCYNAAYGNYDAKLILKDLSDITDEDAIEVANIIGLKEWEEEDKLAYGKEYAMEYGNGIIYRVADFLRSKSYMIPYKGINLFDAGIAIRKQVNNNK